MKTFDKILKTGLGLALCLTAFTPLRAQEETLPTEVDICIYGSTPAGIMAAYTARMKGKSVLLVSPTKRIGGMTAGGLGWTDIGDSTSHQRIIRGYAREFYRRIGAYYGCATPQFYFEPKVALATFQSFLDEAQLKDSVDVWRQWRIVSAQKEGNAVTGIELENATDPQQIPHRQVQAKMFIDCSYEGDLMARAGISYTVGREPASQYGEPENGVQCLNKHQFPDGVDPYVEEGNPESGLLWGIMPGEMGEKGEGNNHIQAYNFRVTLSKTNFRPIAARKPDNYDPSKYELLFRWMKKKGWGSYSDFLKWSYMKGGSGPNSWNALKTDNNNNGAFSTDMIGYSWDYPEATYEERDSIYKLHEDYTKGFLYCLWTDPRVPANIRSELLKWGYPLDEYTDNDNFTPQLYIREARRMLGRLVMTEDYCLKNVVAEDPIAWGAYTMDSHNCGRYVVNGMVKNEGDVQRHLTKGPYNISYRSVTPKEEEARNVLVPVCLSASHIAYGSIRMEPVYMVLGQTTALAAIQAIDQHNGVVQEVDPSLCLNEMMNGLQTAEDTQLPDPETSFNVDLTPRVLQNPSFEDPGTLTDATRAPLGWKENYVKENLQREILSSLPNADGKQGYCCKPPLGGTLTTPFKLYQEIPAEKLGKGLYRVSCMMWVEKDFYGTSCLFADNLEGTRCHVQYWTERAYYQNDLQGYDGLTYTDRQMSFARHAGGLRQESVQWLQPMEVYISLEDGEGMQLGIRTSSTNQGVDKKGAGYFIVDAFKVEKVKETRPGLNEFSDQHLQNYDFELDPEGATRSWTVKAMRNEADQGPILGWQSNAWTDSYGGFSNGSNLAWKWGAWVDSKEDVIPNDFRLYQTIPADQITPGIYMVNARMWQNNAQLGIARLYGWGGSQCSSMFYGQEKQYDSEVLPAGETVSFAGLTANTASGRMSELSLEVEVPEGADLELGVQSGYGAESNHVAGSQSGRFYVDLVRACKRSDLPLTLSQTSDTNELPASGTPTRAISLAHSLKGGETTYVCLPFSLSEQDIKAVFGAGTTVEIPTGLHETTSEVEYATVDRMEAGKPYRICPADPLPSPLRLDGVSITATAPQSVAVGELSLRGTFQCTPTTPAFSASWWKGDEETSIDRLHMDEHPDVYYDMSGRPAQRTLRGQVYVTKGRKVRL